jgi:hypothetical protein
MAERSPESVNSTVLELRQLLVMDSAKRERVRKLLGTKLPPKKFEEISDEDLDNLVKN